VPLSIKFIGALRHLSGKTQVTIEYYADATVKNIIDQLSQEFPALKHTFSDNDLNDSRSNSLVLVNGTEISVLNGYNTKLNEGDEIVFVPVVHGG
jgi:molybdopterin synthase sulfur carrier subunit